MKKWKDCVSDFQKHTNNYGDVAGDTYHFWGGFVGGLTTNIVVHQRDRILNPIYRVVYNNVDFFTDTLKFKLAGVKGGRLHGDVDRLGFRIGEAVALSVIDR